MIQFIITYLTFGWFFAAASWYHGHFASDHLLPPKLIDVFLTILIWPLSVWRALE